MHPPFKGRDLSGYKIYMENNVIEGICQENGRGGDAISNRDSAMLNHLQNHNDKSGKSNSERIILEIYIDDCNVSVTS